jgi:hypothetical protein
MATALGLSPAPLLSAALTGRQIRLAEGLPLVWPEHVPSAKFWPVANLEYHHDRTAVSKSALDDLRANRWEFYLKRVAGRAVPSVPSEAMALGSAFELFLLQPELFESQVQVLPPSVGPRSAPAVAAREAAAAHGCVAITHEQRQKLGPMREAVLACPAAVELLYAEPVWVQHAVRFKYPGSGVLCKALFDVLRPDGVVVDLKCMADPRSAEFGKSCANFGYHRQHALYAVARDLYLGPCPERQDFLFIAVGTGEHPECLVHYLPPAAVDLGRRQVAELVALYQDLGEFALEAGGEAAWHNDGHASPNELLSFPRWAF